MNEQENENNEQIKSFYGESDISIPDDLLVPDSTGEVKSYHARNIKDDVEVSFKFCFLPHSYLIIRVELYIFFRIIIINNN